MRWQDSFWCQTGGTEPGHSKLSATRYQACRNGHHWRCGPEPSRVKAIVYADAYVPDNGASVWSLTTPTFRERFVAGAAADGLACAPPAHLDSRCRPHPMATFLQAIKLTLNWRNVRSKAFIAAFGWEGSPFLELYERLRPDPEWVTHRLDCAHDVPRLAPEALATILLEYV